MAERRRDGADWTGSDRWGGHVQRGCHTSAEVRAERHGRETHVQTNEIHKSVECECMPRRTRARPIAWNHTVKFILYILFYISFNRHFSYPLPSCRHVTAHHLSSPTYHTALTVSPPQCIYRTVNRVYRHRRAFAIMCSNARCSPPYTLRLHITTYTSSPATYSYLQFSSPIYRYNYSRQSLAYHLPPTHLPT